MIPAQNDNTVCPACGLAMEGGSACGTGCAKSGGGCAMLCCPHCGTTFPDPRKAGFSYRLARWLLGGKAAPGTPDGNPILGKEPHD